MANSLIVRGESGLTKRSTALRAAQYVRMSTDFQRYSIQNQAATIAAYAQQNQLTIVRTYADEGRSGLRIKGRAGLIELISDVQSGRADFDQILVYDVSRWGRFQDVDESAHYEFVCKQNGLQVVYCAEQFGNDGSLLSSIVKNIKRVMAAEFSRELSVKVHAGQSRVASLGYRVGGPLTFGLRRELIDENKQSRGRLNKGERKALQTDRTKLQLGTPEEIETIKWIFQAFVSERRSDTEIARQLNAEKVANQHARPWTPSMINAILHNENYIGNIVYDRTSRRLGQKLVHNAPDLWMRATAVVEPVVDASLFAQAQKILEGRRVALPNDQMLARLRMTLRQKGKLNTSIIKETLGLPSPASFVKHFGSLRKAYAMIGYEPARACDWIDTRAVWSEVTRKCATDVAASLRSARGLAVTITNDGVTLRVNKRWEIRVIIARQIKKLSANHAAQWRVFRRDTPRGFQVVVRLNASNSAIQDYLLIPSTGKPGRYLTVSDLALTRHEAIRFDSIDDLTKKLKARLKPR